jgi:hypothetical protein
MDRSVILTMLVVACLVADSGLAAFVRGVEGFDGTVKDTVTWEERLVNPGPTRVFQNDAVTLDFGGVGYATTNISVGVGATVSVEFLDLSVYDDPPMGGGSTGLFLTTKDGVFLGTDSHYLGVEYVTVFDTPFFWGKSGGSGSGSGTIFGSGTAAPTPGNYYVLEVERTSSTSANFRALRSDGSLIGSVTRIFTDVPDQLYVLLVTSATLSPTFDNVTIPFVPPYSGGDGSVEDPYRIATAEDLNDIGNHVEDFNKCFVLVNDINLAAYTGTQFNMIADTNNPFTGVFDGNGHTI